MRKFNFEDEYNFEILEIKNMISKLIDENYTIERIKKILGISETQLDKFINYQYKIPAIEFKKKEFIQTEEELFDGTSTYTFDNLSPAEKEIFKKL